MMAEKGGNNGETPEELLARLRSTMVQKHLADRGIKDARVLDAMGRIPREKFVRENDLYRAYADHPLSIDSGQTISQPYMVALMTELLDLRGGEKVLEIGTGSGYQTAILAELSAEVYTVERHPGLSEKAQRILADTGCTNVSFMAGDGTLGWPRKAPFDRIIVTAAAPKAPPPLLKQLAVGGKMIIPVGQSRQALLEIRRTSENAWEENELTPCVFVPLIGREGFPEGNPKL